MSAKSAETSNSVPLPSSAQSENSPDNSSNNMSDDDSSSNSSATRNESPDPLQLSENDLQNSVESRNFLSFKKSEDESSSKRKNPEGRDEDTNKKQKTEEINLNNVKTEQSTENSSKNELEKEETDKNLTDLFKKEIKAAKEVDISELIPEKEEVIPKKDAESDSDDFDVTEKLKEMGEISVKAVSKTEASKKSEPAPDNVEITKKDKKEMQERKVTNFRKNIKDVIDDSQLDAATLAAQRQESERLARVQEQQRIIREMQRQIAMEKQTSKTQQKIMSFLQGHALKTSQASTSGESLLKSRQPDENNKINLTPSVSIQPASSRSSLTPLTIKSFETLEDDDSDIEIQEKIEELKQLTEELESDEDDDDDDCRPIEEKKTIVTIDSSSDDDCIILSDDDEPEEEEDDPHNSGLHVKDSYNTPNSDGKVVVNIGHPEDEPDIFVAPQIEKIIKPHQIGGVRFLFDNIIESVERFNTSTGFGCILAHSMGLGKTLQLVCFCDIFLRHTSSKTVLVIMPINTLQNWLNEFNMWLPAADDVDKCPLNGQGEVRSRNFKIHVLNDSQKTLNARAKVVMEWAKDGGVLMMGYEMYRLLSQKKMSKPKKSKKKVAEFLLGENVAEKTTSTEDQDMFDKIHEALVKPGPDLVVW